MVKIHYENGPEILQDVSMECYNSVMGCLAQGQEMPAICKQLDLSEEVVEAIKQIVDSKMKRCCFCGKIFNPQGRSRATTCGDVHYLPCVDCGTPVKVNESYANYVKAGGRRCPACRGKQIGTTRKSKSEEEKKAIVAKQEATMLAKYGAKNALQVPEIRERVRQTVKERYGVDNVSQSAEVQDTIKKNSQDRYGVDHYASSPEVRDRMIAGMISKYGVAFPLQSAQIQDKMVSTNLERYGVANVFQSQEVRDKFVSHHLETYGVAWPHQRPEVVEKAKETNIERYGAPMRPISDEFLCRLVVDRAKFKSYQSFIADPEKYIQEHYKSKPSVRQLSQDLGVTDTPIYYKLISIGKRDLATEHSYTMESELIQMLLELDPAIKIEQHNRTILEGKEIDVFLPDFNIGFECNPTVTHNSSFPDPWGNPPKSYRYHADKSALAVTKGVFIYHIFGYEWSHRHNVIRSQI